MVERIIFLLAVVFFVKPGFSQTSPEDTYFERLGDSTIQFYYDQNYFLTDKDCEFRAITRTAGFNRNINGFQGKFTDINAQGQVVLEGHYVNGQKHGKFTAYHPNRILKWEVTFQENSPTGYWNYYYPDGKPLLSVSYHDSTTRIVSMWDRRGRLKIKNGSGRYEFRNPMDGFSKYGFAFYRSKGRITNGVPTGLWSVYYEDMETSDAHLAAEEFYQKGILRNGYHFYEDAEYTVPSFVLLPYDNFYRAESLLFKACNFDEASGFTLYLSQTLTNMFQGVWLQDIPSADFSYAIKVRDDGLPHGAPQFSKTLPPEIQRLFEEALKTIDFYVPSFKQGKYIDDTLTISGRAEINAEGKVQIQSIQIHRAEENR